MKWANKKQNINIYNTVLKKGKKNTCRYHWQNLDDMRYIAEHTEIGNFRSSFALLPPWKPQILKNEKNAWRYYHFTQIYQNQVHMLYCSWDMACDRCNYWTIFCTFTLLTGQKMKISPGDVIILHKCTKYYDQMVYCS